jgi:hypothetical protein
VAIVLISQPIANMIRDVVAAHARVRGEGAGAVGQGGSGRAGAGGAFVYPLCGRSGRETRDGGAGLARGRDGETTTPSRSSSSSLPPRPPPTATPTNTGHPGGPGDPVQGQSLRPVAGLAAAARQDAAGRAVKKETERRRRRRRRWCFFHSRTE